MTGRALAAAAVAAVWAALILICAVTVFQAAARPYTVAAGAWLAVMFVTVTASGAVLGWLRKQRRGGQP